MSKVNIAGIDKALLVKALYDKSQPLGMGIIADSSNPPMTLDQIRNWLDTHGYYIDYLQGRVMKIDVSKDVMDTWAITEITAKMLLKWSFQICVNKLTLFLLKLL